MTEELLIIILHNRSIHKDMMMTPLSLIHLKMMLFLEVVEQVVLLVV